MTGDTNIFTTLEMRYYCTITIDDGSTKKIIDIGKIGFNKKRLVKDVYLVKD